MKLRPEVEAALLEVRVKYGPGRKPTRTQLLALVELGVRIGVRAASAKLTEIGWNDGPYFEAVDDLDDPDCIRDILQAQPGAEGE